MVVGFVNAGMMMLSQAIWIIMGSYSTLLINFERIGDHFLNIAELLQKI